MLIVGIDISKATFDCVVLDKDILPHRQFVNDVTGFKALSIWLKQYQEARLFCMEATGIYGVLLAKYLHQQDHNILVVNPIKTHAFAKMAMTRNKTDKVDAKCIAHFCQHLVNQGDWQRQLFRPKALGFERLQHLVTRLEQLNKLLNQENNRLQVSQDKATTKSITAMIKSIKTQLRCVEKTLSEITEQEPELKNQVALLNTINGIGNKTAWAILAYLGDITLFDNAKQVASYAGLNPKIEQSGSSVNRSRLSKIGNPRLRKALYMPSLVAIQHNPLMTQLYERLQQNGKPKKVALCAVMRKLLVLSYGVLKSGEAFDVNYAK